MDHLWNARSFVAASRRAIRDSSPPGCRETPLCTCGELRTGVRHLRCQTPYQLFVRATASGRRTRMRASTATQPVGQREHRVQVELGDSGEVLAEAREAQEEVDERGPSAAGAPRKPGDEAAGLAVVDELLGVDVRERARSGRPPRRSARPARRPARTRRAARTTGPGRRRRAARRRRASIGWTITGSPIRAAAPRPPPRRGGRARRRPSRSCARRAPRS